ncbi:pyridoxamine 5'-phosphate oxidase family protein [Paralimibaculum aggregatum]|uniref:Pyridoxamine 5'-phosphate oxidase family protein n=1 Tax=Paralimibaculum aggregatum TaxID=3036245 RepID=A0ABQ6LPC4_9RHOB|nr:pyridoxamine 5'-phosphate oxidase family protein [Limibaculum sp. NKW23]GMG84155.1 pyridoxamine 5'-phosphate oxidase family protein [Limibaculum sp. NKW23]
MARAFAEIAFTPAVRAAQALAGSARVYDRFLAPEAEPADRLGPEEAAFIAARDGFYQATVSETGWPYVQFRGGPPGFLRVLDDRTIGYADLRGNRQYVSIGNLGGDGRISLILMDYPNRRRLKVMGRARSVDLADDPELVARLAVEGYPGRPERAVLIEIAGLDWNCPAHIPQRLTIAELEAHLAPVRREFTRLEAENAWLRERLAVLEPGAG